MFLYRSDLSLWFTLVDKVNSFHVIPCHHNNSSCPDITLTPISQNTLDNDLEMEGRSVVAVARYHRRLQLLLRAIFAVSGQVILASHWSGCEEQTVGAAGVCPEHEHCGDPGAEQQGLR